MSCERLSKVPSLLVNGCHPAQDQDSWKLHNGCENWIRGEMLTVSSWRLVVRPRSRNVDIPMIEQRLRWHVLDVGITPRTLTTTREHVG